MKTNPNPGTPAQRMASLESYGPETAWVGRSGGKGRGGPAPAGALQRNYEGFSTEESLPGDAAEGGRASRRPHDDADQDYVPRRGAKGAYRISFGRMLRGLLRSPAGRVVLGVGFVMVLAAMSVGIAYARRALLHDGRFVVASPSKIAVAGNLHLTRAEALTVFGADVGRNIFQVPLSERRADLERLPWVRHATVMRLLPDRLRVQVEERVPVAFVRQGTRIGLADANGVLLDMPEADAGDPQYSFPVLTGITATDPLSTRAARMGIYLEFMKALDGSHEHFSRSISEVDVSDPEDVRALVTAGDTDVLVHFGEADYLERYRSFEAHLPAWRTQYPKLAAADMRYEGQIVLQMAHGAAAIDAAGEASGSHEGKAVAAVAPKEVPTELAKARAGSLLPRHNDEAVMHRETKQAPSLAMTATPAKPLAVHAAAKPLAKSIVVKPMSAKVLARKPEKSKLDGRSAANERMFAELAAAHKKQAGVRSKAVSQ